MEVIKIMEQAMILFKTNLKTNILNIIHSPKNMVMIMKSTTQGLLVGAWSGSVFNSLG